MVYIYIHAAARCSTTELSPLEIEVFICNEKGIYKPCNAGGKVEGKEGRRRGFRDLRRSCAMEGRGLAVGREERGEWKGREGKGWM